MKRRLEEEDLEALLSVRDCSELSYEKLAGIIEKIEDAGRFKPDGICRTDPRTGDRIIYNTRRGKRPHDNRPADASTHPERPCVICRGETSPIIDAAALGEGFTFINENTFPILHPGGEIIEDPGKGVPARGAHLLQWTSSLHDKDWHNMPRADRVVVMERLAALERSLLTTAKDPMPDNSSWGDAPGRRGFVCAIKNEGRLVGGSLAHGHQQIAFSNVMPRRFADNLLFETERGEKFSCHMLRETPPDLVIRDLGPAVLLVPYFMRRPLDMMLVMRDASKRYLFELSPDELTAAADGWHLALRAVRDGMAGLGRELAYNVVTHNGPGAGLYFEFLPYTQETGGYEHLGLHLCQGNPRDSADALRGLLENADAA